MATKDARGTKLTCQNEECGARYYDLDREPPTCPMCGTTVKVAPPPAPPEPPKEVEKIVSGADEGAEAKKNQDPDAEAADELEDVEIDDSLSDDDESDKFLESDDADDTSNVPDISGSKKTDEKES